MVERRQYYGCDAQTYGALAPDWRQDGFTEFHIGVIVAGPRCITLAVRTPPNRQPVRTTLRFGRCTNR